jgi:hypothetical protein
MGYARGTPDARMMVQVRREHAPEPRAKLHRPRWQVLPRIGPRADWLHALGMRVNTGAVAVGPRQARAGLATPAANNFTSAAPAMKPPMCAMNATPPPDCGPCPMTPNALINWKTNQSPTAT